MEDQTDFKRKLVTKSGIPQKTEIRDIEWKSLDETYSHIVDYTDQLQDSMDKKKSKKVRSRRSKYQHTIHLFDDMHKDMKGYWEAFGFLNKSTSSKFALSILPALKVIHYRHGNTLSSSIEHGEQKQDEA